ncbi:MAG TPA: hypothetical protein VIK11_02030, partial [Tepidiformaceae bacterium]
MKLHDWGLEGAVPPVTSYAKSRPRPKAAVWQVGLPSPRLYTVSASFAAAKLNVSSYPLYGSLS